MSPLPDDLRGLDPLLDYDGPGASALCELDFFMWDRGERGATLAEAQAAVAKVTGLSERTVEKAWHVLLDLDNIAPAAGRTPPRAGRHRERHVHTGGPR